LEVHFILSTWGDDRELAIAGEAVLFQRVSDAIGMDLVIEGFAHCGEEDRRVAVPEAGICCPEILATLFDKACHLGAMFRDLYGDNVIGEEHRFLIEN